MNTVFKICRDEEKTEVLKIRKRKNPVNPNKVLLAMMEERVSRKISREAGRRR